MVGRYHAIFPFQSSVPSIFVDFSIMLITTAWAVPVEIPTASAISTSVIWGSSSINWFLKGIFVNWHWILVSLFLPHLRWTLYIKSVQPNQQLWNMEVLYPYKLPLNLCRYPMVKLWAMLWSSNMLFAQLLKSVFFEASKNATIINWEGFV